MKTVEGTVKILGRPGGIILKEKGEQEWFNPADDEVKKEAKTRISKGDKVKLFVNSSKQYSGFEIVGEPKRKQVKQPSEVGGRFVAASEVAGVPETRMVTRAGALNTAIQAISDSGEEYEDADELMNRAMHLANNVIRYVYRGSREGRMSEKVKENHE